MIPLRDLLKETAVPQQNDDRSALRFAIGMNIIIAAVLIIARIMIQQQRASLILGPFSPVVMGGFIISALLIWRNRKIMGAALFATLLMFAAGAVISQRHGLGIMLAIDVAVLSSLMLSRALPQRLIGIGISLITVGGVGLLAAELYWPTPRLAAQEFMPPALFAITVVILLFLTLNIARQFADYSLRAKLVFTFLAITFIPLSITALVNSMVAKQARIDSANQRLLTTASQTAVSIDDFLNNTLNNIRAEAGIMGAAYDWAYYRRLPVEDRSSLGILGEAKAHELLKTYRDKAPLDIASYALLDMDGQIMFEYPASDHNRDESNQSYFETVIETGRPYISPVEFSAEDGEAYLYFSALVYDHSGERFGVLRAQHHAAVLQTLIARSTGSIGGQSFAVLFDENHLHLAHGSAPEALYKLTDLPAADEVAALQAAQRLPDWPLEELSTDLPDLDADLKNALADPFFTAIDIATGNRLNQAAVSKTDAQPWLVAFFQPQDVFLASIQSQIRHTVWLVSLLMIIVTFVAITVAGLITRSIVRLEAVAAQIAAGDIIAQAPVESNDEIGALARAFNLMTEQMRDLIATLEQRVAERTRALEISNNVSRRLSTILDQQELVQAVVQQMQQAFGYYHAHIYLFDEAGENLVMVSGTGEAGRTMLARRHQIPAGQGLIGQAGQTHNVVLEPDVSREKGWLPNPLLPDTKAEVAVPIISGERVLGVLDVQQDVVGGLTETDVRLLQSVANQTAIGLQNARLYARTQQLAAREGQINVIGQKIQSATTVEEALQTAVRELGRALNAKETLVRLKSTKNAENGRSEN